MSTIIMSACWPLQGMSPAQKAVLVSLADMANDDGVCWPSVKHLARRTCLSERSVQSATKWLIDQGAVAVRERAGRSTVYIVTPAAFAPPQELRPAAVAPTPANAAPTPANAAPTPANAAPTPANAAPRTIKEPSKEPSGNRNTAKPPAAVQKFDPLSALQEIGVDEQIAQDWLSHRKAKRAPVTITVLQNHIRQAELAGLSLEEALATTCSRGWVGFEAKFVQDRQPAYPGTDRRGQPTKSAEEVNREAYEILFGKGEILDA